MKKRILLTTFVALVISFAFGQIKVPGNVESVMTPKVGRQLSGLEQNDYLRRHGLLFLENTAIQTPGLKSSSAKQKLDSLVSHSWDGSGSQWINSSKDEYIYDASGKWTTGIYYNWSSITNRWVGDYKDEYTYHVNGKWATDINYVWNTTSSQWVANSKNEFSYNANGNCTQFLIYAWNTTSSQWVADSKQEFTYNAGGYCTQIITSDWNATTSEWVYSMKNEYTYNTSDKCTQILTYTWDGDLSMWIVGMKDEFTYDANNRMATSIHSIWYDEATLWFPMMKYEYAYGTSGKTATEIRSNWDFMNNKWVNDSKYEFAYDANGNNNQSIVSNWNHQTSQWDLFSKEENTFDLAYQFSDLIFPSGAPSLNTYNWNIAAGIVNKPLADTGFLWNSTGTSWSNNEKTIYYYSELNGTGTNELKANEFMIYPNPVSDGFRLNTAGKVVQVSIYDLSGSLLLAKQISDNEYINVSTLSQGIYMVRVASENGLITKKFVKR